MSVQLHKLENFNHNNEMAMYLSESLNPNLKHIISETNCGMFLVSIFEKKSYIVL